MACFAAKIANAAGKFIGFTLPIQTDCFFLPPLLMMFPAENCNN